MVSDNLPCLFTSLDKFVPRFRKFLFGFDVRTGCAVIGILSMILPIVDTVQISSFLLMSHDEKIDVEKGEYHCPNDWFVETDPISNYGIYSSWPLPICHLAFAIIYLILSILLIGAVMWNSRILALIVLLGGIIVYIPSAAVYIFELVTSFKSFLTSPAAYVFFCSPFLWIYCVAIVHEYYHRLEGERLVKKGNLVRADLFPLWEPKKYM